MKYLMVYLLLFSPVFLLVLAENMQFILAIALLRLQDAMVARRRPENGRGNLAWHGLMFKRT